MLEKASPHARHYSEATSGLKIVQRPGGSEGIDIMSCFLYKLSDIFFFQVR